MRGAGVCQKTCDFLHPSTSFHQSVPDFKSQTVSFPPHLAVPKAQHFDVLFSQESVSVFVAGTLVRKSMPAAVQLHREPCLDTEKIEKVDAAWVLAAKLEFRKPTVTQQIPQAFLRVR